MKPSNTPTPGELKVLRLTALGFTARETADELGSTEKTVRKQRQDIQLRLGARNAAHAVHLAHLNEWWGTRPPRERRR